MPAVQFIDKNTLRVGENYFLRDGGGKYFFSVKSNLLLFVACFRVRVKLLQDLNENPKYEKIKQEVEQHMDHHMSRLSHFKPCRN